MTTHAHAHQAATTDDTGLNRMAASATLHCLTGCAIGEILGLMIGTAIGLSAIATIGLAVGLAFLFGYALSTLPLLNAGLSFFGALSVVFAADTLSIAVMEIVDNSVMAIIPGAMEAGLTNPIFWLSMMLALSVAYVAAFPVNRFLLRRGKGHALTHAYHEGHGDHGAHGEAAEHGPTGHQHGEGGHCDHGAGGVCHCDHDDQSGEHGHGRDDHSADSPKKRGLPIPNTVTLAVALVTFMLGGLTVAIADELANDDEGGSSPRGASSLVTEDQP